MNLQIGSIYLIKLLKFVTVYHSERNYEVDGESTTYVFKVLLNKGKKGGSYVKKAVGQNVVQGRVGLYTESQLLRQQLAERGMKLL
jgi:hypothetical protein